MLKAVLLALSALLVLFLLAGAIIVGAQSLSVPVSYIEQQDCLNRANAENNTNQNCPKTETVWDRGLADPVAFYTLWLTLFTLALAIGAAFQSGLIGRQISLSRDEFIAAHRPRLRVRAIRTDGIGGATFITFANIGDSKARVTGTAGTFDTRRDGRWLHGYPDTQTRAVPPPEIRNFEPGRRRAFMMQMQNFDGFAITEITQGREILSIVGAIRYADDLGIERWTGFCWNYDPATQEFINPEKETDLNYED